MEVSKLNVGTVSNNSKLQIKNTSSVPYFTARNGQVESDEFVKKDGSNDNKFTVKEALKNLGKGIISPFKAIVKHPILSIGMIAATVGACALVPALAPIMTIGFGALSLFEVGKGTYNAFKEYKNGNYDNSEKAFEKIGSGIVGTVLTALGLKSTAKTSLEVVETQKLGRPLSSLEKLNISEKVKASGMISALKDNLKIFSKDGLKAVASSLKPSNIIANAKQLISSSKTKSAVSPEELNRRSKMTTKDIQNEVNEILNKTFDEMGIPKEARPKVVISDELRYQSVEDANKIISEIVDEELKLRNFMTHKMGSYNVEVFQPGEKISQFSNEEILARLKSVLAQDSRTKFLLDKKYILDSIVNVQKKAKGGFYDSATHSITVNTGGFRKGIFGSLEEIVSHEALHAKMALYRNSLSTEESAQIVKNLLRDRIINGEPEQIFKEGSILGNVTIPAPKMTTKMRQDFLRYADEFIFATGDKTQASSKLSAILDANPEFIAQNGGTRDAALKVLENYVTSHKNRYNLFSGLKLQEAPVLNLTPEQHKMAVESLRDFVATIEGNSRTGGLDSMVMGPSRNAFRQYEFSPEELLARNTAAEFEKSRLTAMLEDASLSAKDRAKCLKRIQTIESQLEYNRIGKEFYELYTRSLNNPDDTALAAELKVLEKKLNQIKAFKSLEMLGFQHSPSFPVNELAHFPKD